MDYYDELGVSRSATDVDIKKACVPAHGPDATSVAPTRTVFISAASERANSVFYSVWQTRLISLLWKGEKEK